MKRLLSIITVALLTSAMCSCGSGGDAEFSGKEYANTYLLGTMKNDYGKGGFNKTYRLKFSDDGKHISLYDEHKMTLPDAEGNYSDEVTSQEVFTVSYKVRGGQKVVLDSEQLPVLIISGDTLVAPVVKGVGTIPELNDIAFTEVAEQR